MRTLILIGAFCLSGCGVFIDDDKIIDAVKDAGYSSPIITAKHFILPSVFGCSRDDALAVDVIATNVQNKKVSLTVCAGWPFKNITIRF